MGQPFFCPPHLLTYARSRAPVQGGDDSEEIKRRALEQQQQFDDMVRREHGQ
ncbi:MULTISPECIES: hypothetical protein [unclassified Burkholderia]|uniref:hypothetical protein n=1 Tax=unclassified Burkholderia TaxID=2613784 RepID=UPI0013781FF9|nr:MULTISPECIES: hypothetical protein [unclassified Burkholderia]